MCFNRVGSGPLEYVNLPWAANISNAPDDARLTLGDRGAEFLPEMQTPAVPKNKAQRNVLPKF
jgi:hypothetical protein